jgi:hypothetical protein
LGEHDFSSFQGCPSANQSLSRRAASTFLNVNTTLGLLALLNLKLALFCITFATSWVASCGQGSYPLEWMAEVLAAHVAAMQRRRRSHLAVCARSGG